MIQLFNPCQECSPKNHTLLTHSSVPIAMCPAAFSLKRDLKQHEADAHFDYSDYSFECQHCFAAFSSEHDLKQHATIGHENIITECGQSEVNQVDPLSGY